MHVTASYGPVTMANSANSQAAKIMTSSTIGGLYRVVDRPRRLVFTWAWEGDGGERGHETEIS
jgi:uncharacterized protein YndB with AHSA1/START domain